MKLHSGGGGEWREAHAPSSSLARGESCARARSSRGAGSPEGKGLTGRFGALERPKGAWQPGRACAECARGVELFREGRRRAAPASCAPWRAPRERKEREGARREGGRRRSGREGEGSGSEGGFIDRAILVKIFKMADGGAASQDESSAAAAAAAGNHYSILHIHIHTQARLPLAPPAT